MEKFTYKVSCIYIDHMFNRCRSIDTHLYENFEDAYTFLSSEGKLYKTYEDIIIYYIKGNFCKFYKILTPSFFNINYEITDIDDEDIVIKKDNIFPLIKLIIFDSKSKSIARSIYKNIELMGEMDLYSSFIKILDDRNIFKGNKFFTYTKKSKLDFEIIIDFEINIEEIIEVLKTKTNYKKDLIFYNEEYIGYIEIKFYNDIELW